MKTITIEVHSFIDIITNSSTELFIKATEKTINNIETLINSILMIAKSPLKCDDIFLLTLNVNDYDDYDDNEDINTNRVYISAQPILDDENAKISATILSKLNDIFTAVEIEN